MKTNAELNKIAHDLMEVRAMIKQLEAEEEALKDQLKAEMIDRGEEVIEGDSWKASWKNTSNSRFDSKSFKADHEDLYNKYMKNTTGTRFTFSV